MAKPRNNDEMIHRFCNGYRDNVRTNNMSIEGNTLYSYRLPIGKYIGETLLIHHASSTSTTNKQLASLRFAARGQPRVHPESLDGSFANYQRVREALPDLLLKASKARLNSSKYLLMAQGMMEEANKYAVLEGSSEVFDVVKELGVDLVELKKAHKLAEKARLAADAARREKIATEAAEEIAAWRTNPEATLSWAAKSNSDTMLRINGDEIQTSRGAAVPLAVAPILWKMVQRAMVKHNDYTPGLQLGHYTLTRIDKCGDITVGCHHIKYPELKTLAIQLELYHEAT